MEQDGTFDNQPSSSKAFKAEIQRSIYMQLIREVVVYSGKTFAQPQKLLWNLQDSSPSPDVVKVFEEHYGGSYRALRNAIGERHTELRGMIREANARARGLNLEPVEDIDGLIYLLLDADRRRHYRARIDQFNDRKQMISFAQLEEEHRNWGQRKT